MENELKIESNKCAKLTRLLVEICQGVFESESYYDPDYASTELTNWWYAYKKSNQHRQKLIAQQREQKIYLLKTQIDSIQGEIEKLEAARENEDNYNDSC